MPEPLTRADVKTMSPEQINADWDRVRGALSGQEALPDDLTDASDGVLGRAASDPDRWPAVEREMARRGQAAAAARKRAREEFEAELARLDGERQRPPQFGPVDRSIGR